MHVSAHEIGISLIQLDPIRNPIDQLIIKSHIMDTISSPLFPVLNLAKVKRASEADRRLPSWLSHPTQFAAVNLADSSQDLEDFAPYIDEDLRRYLKNVMHIERVFPVQKCLIPDLSMQFQSRPYRRPNDVCVSSPTGSGKTLAFAIPIVNYLKQTLRRSLRALVILPSRDLAQQVFKAFQQLTFPTHLRCAIATDEGAFNLRSDMIDILVSTPGVLTDLLNKDLSLEDLEILVMDEADRLMTSHKHDWLQAVEKSIFQSNHDCACDDRYKRSRVCYASVTGCALKHAHQSRPLHKLLFSATLSSDPQLLMHMNLFQPRLFLATKPSITSTKIRHSLGSANSTPIGSPVPFGTPRSAATVNTRSELLTSTAIPEQLEEKMFITEAKEKLFILWYLFHELKYKKVICFTNQVPTCARLFKFLNEIHDVRAVEFSSNSKPETRQKYINEFKSGRIEVIVSTDLMARGMDIDGVDYVISYDMPTSEIFYVHRVGRTARAGKKGTAITLVDTKQLVQFKKIVQLAHKMPHSMRLGDVVEEMRVPPLIKKDAEKYDLYTKTLEDYEDKINMSLKKNKLNKSK